MTKPLNTKERKREIDRRRKRAEISPERVKQFERLLGRKWRGPPDSAHGTPLMVLCDRGYITDDMKDRGHMFQKLFNTFYPGVKGNHIAELSGRGSIGMLPQDREEALMVLSGHLKRAGEAIRTAGAYDIVYPIAVGGVKPDWLERRIAVEDDQRREVEKWRDAELNNFVPVKDQSIVSHNKQINKRADKIIANIREHVEFKMTGPENQELEKLKSGLQALING